MTKLLKVKFFVSTIVDLSNINENIPEIVFQIFYHSPSKSGHMIHYAKGISEHLLVQIQKLLQSIFRY